MRGPEAVGALCTELALIRPTDGRWPAWWCMTAGARHRPQVARRGRRRFQEVPERGNRYRGEL